MTNPQFKMRIHEIYCALIVIQPLQRQNRFTGELVRTDQVSVRPESAIIQSMQEVLEKWESTALCGYLKSSLSAIMDSTPITKIVGFACGSFSEDADHRGPDRSLYQHMMILSLKKFLSIECFVQDPIYTETEKKILEDLGITVLENPLGFLEVDQSTIVVSFAPDIPVRQVVCELTHPAVLLWDRVSHQIPLLQPG